MEIKAIETIYKGYRFRSRSEARWAVFFDYAGIKYQYEPEGIKLSDGTLYLPDFYLPECDTWFEVKGVLDEVDKHKVLQLISDTQKPAVIGYSDLTFQASDNWTDEDGKHFELTTKDSSWLCVCKKCKKPWFMGGNGGWTCLNCGAYDGDWHFEIALEGAGSPPNEGVGHVAQAYYAARQARFERGEKPRHDYL